MCPGANARAGSNGTQGPTPIFIIGVPRSRTTLLERMLGNHSQAVATGELSDFGAQLYWLVDTRNIGSDTLLEKFVKIDYAELDRRYLARTRWRVDDRSLQCRRILPARSGRPAATTVLRPGF